MSAQWQRRSAVAALLWCLSHVALADGVTIGGDLNINIGSFVFCDTPQTGPSGSTNSTTNSQCTLEASQIIVDPYGHSINTTTITVGANSMAPINAPSCSTRGNPRVRNRLLGTHVVGCKP